MLSKNAVAIAVFVAGWAGLNIAESQIVEALSATAQLISFFIMVWNQLDRKDINFFFWKKQPWE